MTGGDSYAQISLLFGNPDMVLIAADTAAAVQRISKQVVEPFSGVRQEALDAVSSTRTETEESAQGDGSNHAAASENAEWSLSIDVGNDTEDDCARSEATSAVRSVNQYKVCHFSEQGEEPEVWARLTTTVLERMKLFVPAQNRDEQGEVAPAGAAALTSQSIRHLSIHADPSAQPGD
eukprot:g1917.t1